MTGGLFDLPGERDRLAAKWPRWHIWFVPLSVGGVRWLAHRLPILQADTSAHLDQAIGRRNAPERYRDA